MSYVYYEAASHAVAYNKFRSSPPEELVVKMVDYLTEHCSRPLKTAVDVGCGAGQSTEVLSPFFQLVIGIDPSQTQITEAQKRNELDNITYKKGSAEQIDQPDGSVQLVTAGQACHWFDLTKFYAEAERILVPNGVIALYGYLLPRPRFGEQCQELCEIVDKYYNKTLGKYVLPESRRVYLENYRGDDFCVIPFVNGPMIRDETVSMEQDATLADLIGYISSWSAFQNFQAIEGEERGLQVLQEFEKEFKDIIGKHCPPKEIMLKIQYKYFLLMGRKS